MSKRVFRAALLSSLFLPVLAVSASEPLWKLQEWETGRQLVWAQPGQGGDFGKAKNWLENGSPAKSAPDRETDVLLPAAPKHYQVKGSRNHQVRHVVVEKNGELGGGHRNELEIWGNVDILAGGWMQFVSIRGDKDTYFQIEDPVFPDGKRIYRHVRNTIPKSKSCNTQISHKFQIAKIGNKSVEFLSDVGVSDEVMLQHGKCIISADFRFSGATNKGAFEIYDGGILEIQSGGRLAPFINDNAKAVYNVNLYRNGVIQAGSPERPLTEDAFLCLGFAKNDKPGRSGLYAALGSFIRVYSADPKTARLVVTSITSIDDFRDGQGRPVGNPQEAAKGNKGVMLQLAGDVKLNGVHFDYIANKGIGLLDPSMADEWENVTFGDKCASRSPQQLISKMEADPNTYYHARGDQKSEYGLTLTAMASMEKHLKKFDPFQLATYPENTKLKKIGKGKEMVETPIAVIFEDSVTVEIQCKVPGAQIRYSTDGSLPDGSSPVYTGPFELRETTKLTVRAYKQGVGLSPTYTTSYVVQ
ncbi:MAG: chitobiase/beta-hexosaminidase C-terminal domain-containing protein [Verrucomicrobiota bacterium]